MSTYQLTNSCLRDLASILSYMRREYDSAHAEELEDLLLDACERLAQVPGLGHLREDLTSRPFYFQNVNPYLIVYQRKTDPLVIVGIFHSARDLKRLLNRRRAI